MDNKKYYYLKLKENFYDTDTMIILEGMENGYLYSNILMKMYLRSLKGNGKLMFNDRIPYNTQILAKIVRHNPDVVEKAIKIFLELDLIQILDNGSIYMLDIQNFIGKSTTEADRVRKYRKQIQDEELDCTNVQLLNNKSTPEIEIELEKELEKKVEVDEKKENITNSTTNYNINSVFLQFEKSHSPSEFEKEQIIELVNIYSCEKVFDALLIAQKRNKLSIGYIEGILKTPDKNETKEKHDEMKKENSKIIANTLSKLEKEKEQELKLDSINENSPFFNSLPKEIQKGILNKLNKKEKAYEEEQGY